MSEIMKSVREFLTKNGMYYEDIDFVQGCELFIEEMNKGLNGEESTLEMICTYIKPPHGEIPAEDPVIVMDAGGTNFRVAIVKFDTSGKPIIEGFNKYSMPGSTGEIDKSEFFRTVIEYISPVVEKSKKIGFCFSYPTEILPNKDGRLIEFNKEVRVKNMSGEIIGESLLKALKDEGYASDKKIVLLNDTAATLLGGWASCRDRKFDSYIGFILGTGTNTCYIEENDKVTKIPALANEIGSTIINIESGGFGKAPRGRMDILLDNRTVDPGNHKFEKMIAGAYQGNLVLQVILEGIKEGLFSSRFADNFKNITNLATKEIDDFCIHPYSEDNVLAKCIRENDPVSEKDRLVLYYIIDAITERAAKLVAINIAAIMLKTGKGNSPCLPACVIAEGTTFYKSNLFRKKLDYYVRVYINDRLNKYCEFVKADNATIIGTAIAGLLC